MQGCFITTVTFLDHPKEYKFEPGRPVVSFFITYILYAIQLLFAQHPGLEQPFTTCLRDMPSISNSQANPYLLAWVKPITTPHIALPACR